MPRSSALYVVIAATIALGACSFAPPQAGGGAASTGSPIGAGASSGTGTGLIGGGGAQTGQANINGMNCAEVPQAVAKLPPDILLILDKSGSMNDSADGTCTGSCGANSKWSQTTAAVTQVITATDMVANWGLKFFTSPGGGMC